MKLPDQPDHQGGGVQGCDQLLSRNKRIPKPTNSDFFEEVKSTLPPLHPRASKESF